MTRCASESGDRYLMVDDYQLPYFDCVPPDPSFDDMHEVVCMKGIRPEIPLRWHCDEVWLLNLRDVNDSF